MNYFDKKIRVLGKGDTAKAIKRRFKNAILYDEDDFSKYDRHSDELTVVSPGIPPYNQMVKNSNNIISEYDLFFDIMPLSIWITGTNGKTTTTQMAQHLLEDKNSVCGGNIGVGLGLLEKNAKIWILETSSFTLHYTKYAKPDIFILLPISQDHITWHGTFEEYKNAKLKPLEFMEEHQVAIIPEEFIDYPSDALKITYKNSDDLSKYFNIDKSRIKFNEPFLLDSLMALACEKILFDEINYDKINTFVIDKHKVEEFYDRINRLWIDDSKATNVDATINALIPYKDKTIHIILGGDDKGADLIPLFENIKKLDIFVYAIGSNTDKLTLLCKTYNIEAYSCYTLDIAVSKIDKKFTNNGIGILSPAAASLDQFSSYAQRGKEFKNFVFSLR